MVFLSAFFFILCLRSIYAVKCPSCDDILINTTTAFLPINKSYCETITESASICKSELFIDLIDPYLATIRYITAPSNALIIGHADNESVITISIPLDIGYPYASAVYDCYDKDLCNNEIVQEQYKQLHVLNFTKLITELTKLLYNNQSMVEQNQITCYNQNNKVEKCSINGSCQATLIIERGRSDLLITTCVPDRRPGSTTGLILRLNSVGNNYKKASISYICNKNNCNDPQIVHHIRQMLVKIDLVDSKANSLKFLSIVLFIICILTSFSAY